MAYKVLHILLVALLTFQSVVAVSAVLPMSESVPVNQEVTAQINASPMESMAYHMDMSMDDMPPCHSAKEKVPSEEMECDACDEHEECLDSCAATCPSGLSAMSQNSASLISTIVSLSPQYVARDLQHGSFQPIYHPPIFS